MDQKSILNLGLIIAVSFFLAIFMALPQVVNAVTREWVKRYDGPGKWEDWACAIDVDTNGNVYITGTSEGADYSADYATIKYNSAGVRQWSRRYNGPGKGTDQARGMAVDTNGNVYVTGESYNPAGNTDYATIKYDSAGVRQWVGRYDGPGKDGDFANAIAVDINGNVYVTGGITNAAGNLDFGTIKYNSDGVRQWVRRYAGPANYASNYEYAEAIAVDTNGNVYVTGVCKVVTGNWGDYATIKYDSAGVRQWVRRYDGPGKGGDWPTAIAVDTDGNVYVTGYSENTAGNEDYATIKYNSAGVRQWVRRYDGPGKGNDRANAIALDNNGDVCITGVCKNANLNEDYATIKYSSDGVRQWVRRYDGPGKGFDYATDIAVDTDGNVYVTGFSTNVKDNEDYATIKYNSAGVRQWVKRYDGSGKMGDYARAIAVDTNGNVYVTGSSDNPACNSDYTTIKYAP